MTAPDCPFCHGSSHAQIPPESAGLMAGRGVLGASRLKAAALAIVDQRIKACREAEARYAAMTQEPNGGILGSVELARRSEATERSARMEAELIRSLIADLREAKR